MLSQITAQQWGTGNQGGGQSSNIPWNQSSQFNNLGYKGPAPMVMGVVQNVVCYKCGKTGHIQRYCTQGNNGNSGRQRGTPRGQQGGPPRGGMNMVAHQLADQGIEITDDLNSILYLGVADFTNQQHQCEQSGAGGADYQGVKFDSYAQYSDGTMRLTKN